MTLHVYADLFAHDLDAVAARPDVGLAATEAGELWASPPGPVGPFKKVAADQHFSSRQPSK